MRVRDYKALLSLSEYPVESDRRKITASEQITENVSRSDRRKLRRVSDEDEFLFQRERIKQMREKGKVYH